LTALELRDVELVLRLRPSSFSNRSGNGAISEDLEEEDEGVMKQDITPMVRRGLLMLS